MSEHGIPDYRRNKQRSGGSHHLPDDFQIQPDPRHRTRTPRTAALSVVTNGPAAAAAKKPRKPKGGVPEVAPAMETRAKEQNGPDTISD